MINVPATSVRRRPKFKARLLTPYLFISPWIIGFLVFTIGPLLFSLVISFYDWPIVGQHHFVGFKNYVTMFTNDPLFWTSLGVTLKFTCIFVPLNLVSALILALLLNQKVKGLSVYRTIFYLPTVISGVALGLIWAWFFNGHFGLLNYILSLIHVHGPDWLNSPAWALVALVIASLWGQGSMMLIFLAGLQDIPQELYDAAEVDGAGRLHRFRHVTLPMLSPTILFNLITSIIASFQTLTLALVMTGGGPLRSTYFYALYVYQNAFKNFQMGYASANAWIMFLLILMFSLFVFRTSKSWVHYEGDANQGKK